MNKGDNRSSMDRRDFIKLSAAIAVGGQAMLRAAGANASDKDLIRRHEQPTMTYRKLGRTNFMSSRLVFGGGAALAGGRAVRILERAFEAGINHYDLGSNIAYRGAEKSFAPFYKKHRDKIWVASKAPVMVKLDYGEEISVRQAKFAAKKWTSYLERSLKAMEIEYVDLYYVMGVGNVSLTKCEEMYGAFQKARAAGKVGYFGVSTHKNAQEVLEAAIETGWYDAAMIGITPAGWYDWDSKELVEDSPTLVELAPLLDKAKKAGLGLIGMKTVRYMASMWAGGQDDDEAFDGLYSEKYMAADLSPFQRAYAYVLEHGMDVVNADMQNFKHLEENIEAAAKSRAWFV
ncbi:MAG: aldo/keto reductase [Deltaproteobacteria bacterium]|nr:aldo/keto reductase [Deltaproteobacteria bacterium]